jgi:hypothetical protein
VSSYDAVAAKTLKTPEYAIGVNTFKIFPLLGPYLTAIKFSCDDRPFEDPGRVLIDEWTIHDSQFMFADYVPLQIKNKSLFFANIEG